MTHTLTTARGTLNIVGGPGAQRLLNESWVPFGKGQTTDLPFRVVSGLSLESRIGRPWCRQRILS